MEIKVDEQLKGILEEIKGFDYSVDQWAEIESDDMFQTQSYCGGFDGDAKSFYFRYFTKAGDQFWFDFRLEDITSLLSGAIPVLNLAPD